MIFEDLFPFIKNTSYKSETYTHFHPGVEKAFIMHVSVLDLDCLDDLFACCYKSNCVGVQQGQINIKGEAVLETNVITPHKIPWIIPDKKE